MRPCGLSELKPEPLEPLPVDLGITFKVLRCNVTQIVQDEEQDNMCVFAGPLTFEEFLQREALQILRVAVETVLDEVALEVASEAYLH